MPLLYSFLFIVIIVGALAVLYIYQYNKLQHSKTKIDQAEGLIDEALRERYDLLLRADKLVQSELKSDKTYFKGLDKVKNDDISNYDLDRKLTEYIGILEQIKLDYSDLANNKGFKDLLSESKKINEKLQAAKTYYNKYTSELNDLIRQFPSNVVARMHGIEIKPFFDGKNMQDEIVDDFKF
ncbi:MAG: LemA family protein [Bacilli bacterium]|nr:LemA family protein [Bacilli bacterium]